MGAALLTQPDKIKEVVCLYVCLSVCFCVLCVCVCIYLCGPLCVCLSCVCVCTCTCKCEYGRMSFEVYHIVLLDTNKFGQTVIITCHM